MTHHKAGLVYSQKNLKVLSQQRLHANEKFEKKKGFSVEFIRNVKKIFNILKIK